MGDRSEGVRGPSPGWLRRFTRSLMRSVGRAARRVGRAVRSGVEIYEGIAVAPYRAEIARRYARQRDAFMLATFSDALGVPNPAEFYTLELLPYLMEDFHEWHRRIGLDEAPEGGWRCC